MKREEYHITNGDTLAVPEAVGGVTIVCRECLVDGDVGGDSFSALMETRANFMLQHYHVPVEEYRRNSQHEFEKMKMIPDKSVIHLWFERDLFCQVNLWFVLSLLRNKSYRFHLVLPTAPLELGFGGMNDQEKTDAFGNRIRLSKMESGLLADLWDHFRKDNTDELRSTARLLESGFAFIPMTIQAHIDRLDEAYRFGLPEKVLRKIIREQGPHDFGSIFKQFRRLQPVYGFGDLQVKRIVDHILSD